MIKKVALLGSTGSIGTQTLDVISHYPERFNVTALAAGSNMKELLKQIEQFHPQSVSVATKQLAESIRHAVPSNVRVYYGDEGVFDMAGSCDADFVMSSMVGSRGLKPTLAAIAAGKDIGLANKETLVTAGHIVTEAVTRSGVKLLPVDSEHSAIFQCLNGESDTAIDQIVLTASGGSFRDRTREQLAGVTVEEALQHPNWSMGAKVTIDSATMMNKGLEVIEAHWLFHLPYDQIRVLIHPESIIHSYVQFADRSIIAQMGTPDMRVPIQYALTYPERVHSPAKALDLAELGSLHFQKMDESRFPCLKLAFECGRSGGSAPTVFNAANEIAVTRFLQGEIEFLDIENIITEVLNQHEVIRNPSLEQIEEIDRLSRKSAMLVL